MLEVIRSKDNKTIKEIKKLHEKKYRNIKQKFIVEGLRFVKEALESDFEIEYVVVSENVYDKFSDLKITEDTNQLIVSETIFKDLCGTEGPQGILAVVNNKEVDVNIQDGFYILADKVQDPGNMGTIIRTANAAGANGVILTKGTVDIYNDKTLRSTMGSIFKIPVIIDEDLSFVNTLKRNSFKLITSALDTDKNFYDINLNAKVIIAVGNEGNGISQEIYNISDERVKIPMPGNAESLNVGIAAGIMMFEVVRQKNSCNI
jgi:TrmH family RNA methyltransferase